jgi:alkanesulfonate monooxygenase SsuD/methylene tetrahydromethanopterin reductase-like flavin-dependent oxidoreductase (luciferase family)
MEYGLHLPASSAGVRPDELVRFAQQAEALGFYCLTVADHVIVPKDISVPYPYTVDGKYPGTGYHLETLTTMGYLAGATQRIRFVTSVMILPYRNPIVTAKMLATLDVLSGGRVIVGAGVGWMKEEFETIRTEPYGERGKVTDERQSELQRQILQLFEYHLFAQAGAAADHSHLDRRPQQAGDSARRTPR